MMKKTAGTLALAAALTGSLLVPALAAETTPAITVNGAALDLSGLPAAQGIPMRLVAEADHGSASWFSDDNTGFFYLSGVRIEVSFQDGSVTVDGTPAEGTSALVKDGVTFLPVSFLEELEG